MESLDEEVQNFWTRSLRNCEQFFNFNQTNSDWIKTSKILDLSNYTFQPRGTKNLGSDPFLIDIALE